MYTAIIVAAVLWISYLLASHEWFAGHCLDCGGVGKHKKGCRADRD